MACSHVGGMRSAARRASLRAGPVSVTKPVAGMEIGGIGAAYAAPPLLTPFARQRPHLGRALSQAEFQL